MDEVDLAVPSKKKLKVIADQNGAKPSLTFSGVLNGIDGVASEDSQTIVMPTNQQGRFRPSFGTTWMSRSRVYLGNCHSAQAQPLFKSLIPSITESDLNEVSEMFRVMKNHLSPVKLISHLMRFE